MYRLGLRMMLGAMVAGQAVWGVGQASTVLAKEGWYADPEAHVFAGQYWIYPTSSLSEVKPGEPGAAESRPFQPGMNAFQDKLREGQLVHWVYLRQTYLDVFSSPDMVHWTKHPHALDVKDVTWAAYAVWAPSAIELGGKYYLFFAANDIQKKDTFPGGIGVAVSDAPGGPFKDYLGKPLVGVFHNGAQPIDPMVFKDDDGSIYLYYGGQGHCNVARLAGDLKSVVPMKDGTVWKEITPKGYTEGPFVLKRKGIYYFMWSEGDWGDSSYGVAYATGPTATGPWTARGKILGTDPAVANGPGHHSVLQIPGTDEWFIVYHRHPLGTTGINQRVMAIDRMEFGPDGAIQPVKMTAAGVGKEVEAGGLR